MIDWVTFAAVLLLGGVVTGAAAAVVLRLLDWVFDDEEDGD